MAAITVVGIGADGCAGLSARAVGAVARAQVLVGGERHQEFFPQFDGQRIILGAGLHEAIGRIKELADEYDVCVLASGDPLFFGIGARIVAAVGPAGVEFVPHVSSVQWAFARVGLSWEDAGLLSLHGRGLDGFVTRCRRYRKVACLTDRLHGPAAAARRLLDYGDGDWRAWVCEDLGGPGERLRAFDLVALAQETDVAALNVLVLARTNGWRPPPLIPYLPEEVFARRMPDRGLITKREIRLLSLAALHLVPDSVVWDVGAGCGSVAIEAGQVAYEGQVHAIEADPAGAALCRQNALALGADNVQVVEGLAPAVLADLPRPDAVFVGGSKGRLPEILALSLERLSPGGRIVVNAVTLETVQAAYAFFRQAALAAEVMVVNIARGEPVGSSLRLGALNPIHVLAATKDGSG